MRRLVTAVLCLAALLLAAPAPANAGGTTGRLQVRTSTGAWSDDLGAPLFDPDRRLVPTDRLAGRFEIRNDSPTAARATLAVVSRGPATGLTRTLQVATDVGGQPSRGTWTLDRQGTCTTLVTGPDIPPGGDQAVTVALDFPDVDGTTAMTQSAALEVVVRLSEVGPSGTVDICGVQAEAGSACRADVAVVPLVGTTDRACPRSRAAPSDGSLASTGAQRSLLTLLTVGAMLFVCGVVLVLHASWAETGAAGQRRGRHRGRAGGA